MTQVQAVWLVIAAVYAGLLLATAIVSAVVYDLMALRRGWRTISADSYLLNQRLPWVAAIVAGMLGFACGVLIGHLFYPQFREAPSEEVMLQQITAPELGRLLLGKVPVAVCFSAAWCGACQQMHPTLQTASERFEESEVLICTLDVDSAGAREVLQRYRVTRLPTVVIFREQEVVGKRVGVQPLLQFTAWINVCLLPHGEATALEGV